VQSKAVVTKKRVDSWVVIDDFCQWVQPLISMHERAADKAYVRKPVAGRLPKPGRQVFKAVHFAQDKKHGCESDRAIKKMGSK
jgi:hypothetical protein